MKRPNAPLRAYDRHRTGTRGYSAHFCVQTLCLDLKAPLVGEEV